MRACTVPLSLYLPSMHFHPPSPGRVTLACPTALQGDLHGCEGMQHICRGIRASALLPGAGSPRPVSSVVYRVLASVRSACMSSDNSTQARKFGQFDIQKSELFIETRLSFGFVNIKPVVPGHLLVSPKRVVPRFEELREEEVADLWILAQRVGRVAEKHFEAGSLTLAIQDGPEAGQTVPHVHIHILPRRPGDFDNNDDVYDAIDEASKQIIGDKLDLDKARQLRTHEEMAAEAKELRTLF